LDAARTRTYFHRPLLLLLLLLLLFFFTFFALKEKINTELRLPKSKRRHFEEMPLDVLIEGVYIHLFGYD
jgi:hypothetical protein